MKDIGKKGTLLIVSILLLVCTLLYISVAWYTKMTSVSGMDFRAAKWDFNANYQVDSFIVNVYEYTNVTKDRAAPGTAGEIPILLNAENADTDVEYFLYIDKSSMSAEFQKRLFFYYKVDGSEEMIQFKDKTTVMEGIIPLNSNKSLQNKEVKIYWEWVYDYLESLKKLKDDRYPALKVLYDLNPVNLELFLNNISGCIDGTKKLYEVDENNKIVYQTNTSGEFILDEFGDKIPLVSANPMPQKDRDTLNAYLSTHAGSSIKTLWEEYLTASEQYDAFDTKVGTHTALYENEMSANVIISGEQVKPQQKTNNE